VTDSQALITEIEATQKTHCGEMVLGVGGNPRSVEKEQHR